MPALQNQSLTLNPNELTLTRVGQLERRIEASIERVWENVLDWEHLPYLHETSFDYCELDEAGSWGWRVWSSPEHSSHIELCVDQDQYVARSYVGGLQRSEIWTRLKAVASHATDIEVSFYLSDVPAEKVSSLGESMRRLYSILWDEDEAMMRERQRQLDAHRSRTQRLELGPVAQLRNQLPLTFEFNRQTYELSMTSHWTLTPKICPHLLGPLQTVEDAPNEVRCPWHGYRFDKTSGECLEPETARCRLRPLPHVREENDVLWVIARPDHDLGASAP